MRKIIQIQYSPFVSEENRETDILLALCDDGSVWEAAKNFESFWSTIKWRRIPSIPQDDEVKDD